MKKKKESDHFKRLALLNGSEQDLILYDTLHDKDIAKFFNLLKQGYTLTPFVLNVMIDYGYEDKLFKAVEVSTSIKTEVYDFLCAHLGQEKAEDFLDEKDIFSLIKEKFSVESLVKYRRWDMLAEKEECKVLARAEKFDVLKEHYIKAKNKYNGGHLCISDALIDAARSFNTPQQKIIDFFVNVEDFYSLARIKGGLFKLLELKKWAYIPIEKNLLEDKTPDEVLQLIYDHGGEQYLYKQACDYGNGSDYRKFLFERGYYDLFVANKSWSPLIWGKLYHLIDWDDYIRGREKFGFVWDNVVEAGQWAFLARHRKHALLFRSWKFGWWLKSFTY